MAHSHLRLQPVIDWLNAGAPPAGEPKDLLLALCRRLVAIGLPLYRVALFVRTLHPNVAGLAFFWREGCEEVEVDEAAHAFIGSEEHLSSAVRAVWASGVEIRRRLADPGCPIDFAVLEELRVQGVSDYIAVPVRFINGEIHVASFATRRAGGFAPAELQALRELVPPLSRLAEIYAHMRRARNILDAYLGKQAGAKVLAGQIRRGDGQEIHAVIWFCDLRDSTPLASSMSRRAFLELLNEYFECVLGPVQERAGEILRFIGDAALAIFPAGDDPAGACARAVEAAREAMARMGALNAKRQTPLRFGIGLHMGDVLYGNVGTPSRIEFTVIGAAANEAARIEALCKVLDVPVLASEQVVRHVPGAWRSLGGRRLRGVDAPVELFAIAAP